MGEEKCASNLKAYVLLNVIYQYFYHRLRCKSDLGIAPF
jgi:hypothetical protein